jgi:DNA polymerase III epsilon subunit-like protein
MPKMYSISKKPRRVIDCETTGLDDAEHEIIEICIKGIDGAIVFQSKIKPRHIETAHPKALEINGYNEEDWADAPYFSDVAEEIAGILKWCIWIGHNPSFDLGFVKAELKRVDEELLKGIGYHTVDTVGLAETQLSDIGLDSLSLINVCKFLRIPLLKAHTAEEDTEACRQVYLALRQAGVRDRWRWKRWNAKRVD